MSPTRVGVTEKEWLMTALEESVVDAAADGSAAAVEAVYRILAPRVLGYLRARGVEDPEGLTNEVFLAVIPQLNEVHGGATGLRTLVFSIAHARAVDEHRRRTRRPSHAPYEPDLDTRVEESAETVAMDRLATDRVSALLEKLGGDQRTVVMLRVLAGLSLEETATVLDRSVGSVKQLQRRGLIRLRELLQGEEGR